MLRPWKTILSIELDCGKAVFQQIADGIIQEIRRGRLKPGTPLPGTRVLASDLGVNRKTVVTAYEELIAEGWLDTAYKKGTFVSLKLPETRGRKKLHLPAEKPAFHFNEFDRKFVLHNTENISLEFNDGLPDVRLAPLDALARAYKRIFQQKARWRMMSYGSERGEERLRTAIAAMLLHDRGLFTSDNGICITRGSQMALYLTAQTLVEPGDTVLIETPGYPPAREAFRKAGAQIIPVPVDAGGLRTDLLEEICRKQRVKAIYVTPHHQFPTTVSMKADRRLELIALSNRYGFAIVEDDYDHEFHFGMRSILPLASDEQAANIIYIGSLSKLLAPSVRVGYVIASPAFIQSLASLRILIDRQGDPVLENAVAELMEEGEISRHARRALAVYRERREHMEQCLQKELKDKVYFSRPEGGLAYWVQFRKQQDMDLLLRKANSRGLGIMPAEPCSFNGTRLNALRLGYASLTPEEAARGIQIIRDIL
ncbi:MAG: PLP-dependent aminotransferase family protein [Bacteroidia bacterium]|nr:PLP-dependent aminotransferase family protein [Bacteroidia bacterium]